MPRALQKYLSLDDFEPTARRRIPKFLYGYISGGAETDAALRDNRNAFDEYGFVPRVLNDVSGRDQTTTLFGKTYASPFGIPPMGSSALAAYRGDIVLTQAAKAENVPMILSASSLITLEDVRAANQAAWYQAYLAGLPERIEPLVDRVAAAGYDTFVVTADVPVPPNRENNIRNGFQVPLAITPRVFWDTVTHPHWLFGTWARTVKNFGMPHFENMDAKRGPPVLAKNLMRNIGPRDQLAWKHVELIRKKLERQARRQGTGLAGGCAHRARERRRRRDAVQPWRPPARLHDVGPAHAAGDRSRSKGHDDHGRRRHPPRHRRDQGARARRAFRLDRPSLPLCRDRRRRSRRAARDLRS